MMFRGSSLFVIVAGLCGSACNIYHGNPLTRERQREQPTTAAIDSQKFRDLELERIRPATSTIHPRVNNAGAPSAEPPKEEAEKQAQKPKAPERAVAGTKAPTPTQAPDPTPSRRDELEDAEDAGVPVELDASTDGGTDAGQNRDRNTGGTPSMEADAETPQMIETGRPHEVDAGRPRVVAKVSAACRDELGYETEDGCYFVLTTPVSWNVGRDRCYEHDAHLASVTSERESALIASFELDDDVWIGYSRFGAAHFSWLTNESGSFSNWQKGAPRPMQESGALVKARTGLWTNRAVSELHAALCETERKATRKKR